jgi:hypothetical protein
MSTNPGTTQPPDASISVTGAPFPDGAGPVPTAPIVPFTT